MNFIFDLFENLVYLNFYLAFKNLKNVKLKLKSQLNLQEKIKYPACFNLENRKNIHFKHVGIKNILLI